MNPRHAAALALVGWYLMMPPQPPSNGMSDPATPLSVWHVIRSFDDAPDCERVRSATIQGSRAEIQHQVSLNLLCIATDDPRLKGN